MKHKVCVVYHDMLTVYGHGVSCCVDALFQNQTKFRPVTRFPGSGEYTVVAACFPEGLFSEEARNVAEQAVLHLLKQIPESFRMKNTPFFFALTQGEISKLENSVEEWTAQLLVNTIAKDYPLNKDTRIFSAACASGNIALARAASEIASGHKKQILVIGCDVVSEFTFSGFFSVHAITPDVCRPYDISHDGLLLGDAAGIILLASEETAYANNWPILATIDGFGITTDSYHVAAPNPAGVQMEAAIRKAMTGILREKVAGVIGHGTGTSLNDNMEIAALNSVFPEGIPLASVKGGTGHILAASGLIQMSCAINCLEKRQLFPQTSLLTPQENAEKFVSARPQPLQGDAMLILNAGFGGLNAVTRIGRY